MLNPSSWNPDELAELIDSSFRSLRAVEPKISVGVWSRRVSLPPLPPGVDVEELAYAVDGDRESEELLAPIHFKI